MANIDTTELYTEIIPLIQIGFMKAMKENGFFDPKILKAHAFKQYGRERVEGWMKTGLLKPIQWQQGEKISRLTYFNRMDIVEILAFNKDNGACGYRTNKSKRKIREKCQ